MNNNLIPFDWVKFEQGYKGQKNGHAEIERYKFSDGQYAVLFDDGHLVRVNAKWVDINFSLIVPTVYKYCNLYNSGSNGAWRDTIEEMDDFATRGLFHSYLRGEFVNDELINVEIVKR